MPHRGERGVLLQELNTPEVVIGQSGDADCGVLVVRQPSLRVRLGLYRFTHQIKSFVADLFSSCRGMPERRFSFRVQRVSAAYKGVFGIFVADFHSVEALQKHYASLIWRETQSSRDTGAGLLSVKKMDQPRGSFK